MGITLLPWGGGLKMQLPSPSFMILEAQQRYFFISRGTCSDSIAKLFHACFCAVLHNDRAICCKNGVSRRYAFVKLSAKGEYRTIFRGVLTSLKKVSRDVGYRSDSIAVSRDIGATKFYDSHLKHLAGWKTA